MMPIDSRCQVFTATLAALLLGSISAASAEQRAAPPALSALVSEPAVDMAGRYAPQTRYGIFRKGDRVGTHVLRFTRRDKGLDVQITSDIRVAVLRIPMFCFDYRSSKRWQSRVLGSKRVFNTLTGRASEVRIQSVGRDVLPEARRSNGTLLPALPYTRYRYRGDIDVESWYDDDGRWVGLVFSGEDGSRIEYRIEPDSR